MHGFLRVIDKNKGLLHPAYNALDIFRREGYRYFGKQLFVCPF